MKAEQLMETQKYFGTSSTITCCCCGAKTNGGGGACDRCQVPFVVSESADARGVQPQFIPILGGSGAGKTVYLGMLLDMLAKGNHEMSGQPNNAFSVTIQQETIASLERRRFPEKTICESAEWNWVHCEVHSKHRKSKQPFDLVAPDLAGEALVMELDHPNSFPVVTTCVQKAFAVILLIDAVKARDHGTDQDLLATKIATYIFCNARRNGLVRKSVNIPLAVTFTKTDLCREAADDPEKFAKHNLPGFYIYSERNLPMRSFFATSVVGSVTSVSDQRGDYSLPLHIQPRGIVEPLAWALK